ncbi:hypothetical protein FHR81_003389 [Actinoalloteichus hoggarensis]|uniref:Uncharacterized protein n=1 Tax=Actinoalloteichus hoggarensis TaxID=1470176 RepID=A0A221W7V0_9PSEU|nr:hypothetical protein AHOG_20620 [Actinoalloteichus hoggarensis]MBB5922337.1 hypothetical protein [Actinoalloteichus hoggarensis]
MRTDGSAFDEAPAFQELHRMPEDGEEPPAFAIPRNDPCAGTNSPA